jgi:hypothetical protein
MNWGATMEGSPRLSSLFTRSRKSRKILELDSVLEARSDSRGNSCRIRCSSIAGSSCSGATWAAAAGCSTRKKPSSTTMWKPGGAIYTLPCSIRSPSRGWDTGRLPAAGFPNGSLCVARSGSPPRDPEAWRLIPFQSLQPTGRGTDHDDISMSHRFLCVLRCLQVVIGILSGATFRGQ